MLIRKLVSLIVVISLLTGSLPAQVFDIPQKPSEESRKKLESAILESVRSQSVPVAMSTAVNKVYAAVELDGEEVSELVNPSALMSYEDFVTWQKGNKAAYERSAEYKKAKAKLELDIRGMLSAGKSAVEIESELGLVGGEEEEEAALKRAYAEYESIVKAEEEEVRAARWYLTEGKWDYKEAWRKEREILQKYADDESLEWSHEDYIYIRKYTQALLGYVKEDVVNRAPRVMSELLSLYKTGVHSEYEHKKGSEEIRELVSAGSAAWCNGKMLEGKEKSKEKAANCAKVSEGAVIIGIIGSPLSGVRGEKEGSEEYLQKYMEEYYDSLAGANVIVNSAVGLLNLGERGVRRLKNVLLNLANKEEIESTKGVFSRGMVGMLAEVGIVGAKGFSDERTIVNGGYYLDGVSKVGSYVDKDLANNREHLINGGAWLEHVLVSNAWEDVGRMIADYEGVDGKGCKECAEVISYAVSKSVSKWGEATTVAGNIPFLVGAAQGSKNIKSSDKQKIADGIFGLSFTDLNAANNLALDKKLAYIKGIDAAVYAKGYDIRGKQKSYERSGRIMSGAGVADIVLSVGFAASLARGAVSGARSWVSMFRQASKLKGLGRVPSVRAGISRITVQNLRRAHAQTLLKAPAGRVIPGTERAVNLHNKEISGMKVSVKGAAHNYQNTGSLPKKITPPVRTRATGLKVLEEKPELVAKGNGYNVRKLNDKTLILDLGQRMPGVQPRATGTLTAQAGEGSGGSANSAGPGISTGNVSKYDLLMEVKSTMPKYEPTTVRQPTFRDKFNHVMWQTKMRAAMLSTPVGTTGAVAEGALVTPTQIVSQSKAPASLFDIVESADAARPQRFIGKGTTLVKPQVSALPKSSSAPKTNLLNVGTNRGRGNYHISTPAVTVMAAGYNPLTGRAPYKPTETIHAYANITTPTINYKSDIEALASNKQLNAIITARQSEQTAAPLPARIINIVNNPAFRVAAAVGGIVTVAAAARGLFAPEAIDGVNTLINTIPAAAPDITPVLSAEEAALITAEALSGVLPFAKLKHSPISDETSAGATSEKEAEANIEKKGKKIETDSDITTLNPSGVIYYETKDGTFNKTFYPVDLSDVNILRRRDLIEKYSEEDSPEFVLKTINGNTITAYLPREPYLLSYLFNYYNTPYLANYDYENMAKIVSSIETWTNNLRFEKDIENPENVKYDRLIDFSLVVKTGTDFFVRYLVKTGRPNGAEKFEIYQINKTQELNFRSKVQPQKDANTLKVLPVYINGSSMHLKITDFNSEAEMPSSDYFVSEYFSSQADKLFTAEGNTYFRFPGRDLPHLRMHLAFSLYKYSKNEFLQKEVKYILLNIKKLSSKMASINAETGLFGTYPLSPEHVVDGIIDFRHLYTAVRSKDKSGNPFISVYKIILAKVKGKDEFILYDIIKIITPFIKDNIILGLNISKTPINIMESEHYIYEKETGEAIRISSNMEGWNVMPVAEESGVKSYDVIKDIQDPLKNEFSNNYPEIKIVNEDKAIAIIPKGKNLRNMLLKTIFRQRHNIVEQYLISLAALHLKDFIKNKNLRIKKTALNGLYPFLGGIILGDGEAMAEFAYYFEKDSQDRLVFNNIVLTKIINLKTNEVISTDDLEGYYSKSMLEKWYNQSLGLMENRIPYHAYQLNNGKLSTHIFNQRKDLNIFDYEKRKPLKNFDLNSYYSAENIYYADNARNNENPQLLRFDSSAGMDPFKDYKEYPYQDKYYDLFVQSFGSLISHARFLFRSKELAQGAGFEEVFKNNLSSNYVFVIAMNEGDNIGIYKIHAANYTKDDYSIIYNITKEALLDKKTGQAVTLPKKTGTLVASEDNADAAAPIQEEAGAKPAFAGPAAEQNANVESNAETNESNAETSLITLEADAYASSERNPDNTEHRGAPAFYLDSGLAQILAREMYVHAKDLYKNEAWFKKHLKENNIIVLASQEHVTGGKLEKGTITAQDLAKTFKEDIELWTAEVSYSKYMSLILKDLSYTGTKAYPLNQRLILRYDEELNYVIETQLQVLDTSEIPANFNIKGKDYRRIQPFVYNYAYRNDQGVAETTQDIKFLVIGSNIIFKDMEEGPEFKVIKKEAFDFTKYLQDKLAKSAEEGKDKPFTIPAPGEGNVIVTAGEYDLEGDRKKVIWKAGEKSVPIEEISFYSYEERGLPEDLFLQNRTGADAPVYRVYSPGTHSSFYLKFTRAPEEIAYLRLSETVDGGPVIDFITPRVVSTDINDLSDKLIDEIESSGLEDEDGHGFTFFAMTDENRGLTLDGLLSKEDAAETYLEGKKINQEEWDALFTLVHRLKAAGVNRNNILEDLRLQRVNGRLQAALIGFSKNRYIDSPASPHPVELTDLVGIREIDTENIIFEEDVVSNLEGRAKNIFRRIAKNTVINLKNIMPWMLFLSLATISMELFSTASLAAPGVMLSAIPFLPLIKLAPLSDKASSPVSDKTDSDILSDWFNADAEDKKKVLANNPDLAQKKYLLFMDYKTRVRREAESGNPFYNFQTSGNANYAKLASLMSTVEFLAETDNLSEKNYLFAKNAIKEHLSAQDLTKAQKATIRFLEKEADRLFYSRPSYYYTAPGTINDIYENQNDYITASLLSMLNAADGGRRALILQGPGTMRFPMKSLAASGFVTLSFDLTPTDIDDALHKNNITDLGNKPVIIIQAHGGSEYIPLNGEERSYDFSILGSHDKITPQPISSERELLSVDLLTPKAAARIDLILEKMFNKKDLLAIQKAVLEINESELNKNMLEMISAYNSAAPTDAAAASLRAALTEYLSSVKDRYAESIMDGHAYYPLSAVTAFLLERFAHYTETPYFTEKETASFIKDIILTRALEKRIDSEEILQIAKNIQAGRADGATLVLLSCYGSALSEDIKSVDSSIKDNIDIITMGGKEGIAYMPGKDYFQGKSDMYKNHHTLSDPSDFERNFIFNLINDGQIAQQYIIGGTAYSLLDQSLQKALNESKKANTPKRKKEARLNIDILNISKEIEISGLTSKVKEALPSLFPLKSEAGSSGSIDFSKVNGYTFMRKTSDLPFSSVLKKGFLSLSIHSALYNIIINSASDWLTDSAAYKDIEVPASLITDEDLPAHISAGKDDHAAAVTEKIKRRRVNEHSISLKDFQDASLELVPGEKYIKATFDKTEGKSSFIIPVTSFDYKPSLKDIKTAAQNTPGTVFKYKKYNVESEGIVSQDSFYISHLFKSLAQKEQIYGTNIILRKTTYGIISNINEVMANALFLHDTGISPAHPKADEKIKRGTVGYEVFAAAVREQDKIAIYIITLERLKGNPRTVFYHIDRESIVKLPDTPGTHPLSTEKKASVKDELEKSISDLKHAVNVSQFYKRRGARKQEAV
ncbi:hypothetical protein Dip518_000222 [Parelusimicrobium proximum]|uniref:hypothetical protein n=1 Tax=Parelusimicrobium proximum TaxID=3228953 RepID=UPI003D17957D